MYSNKMCVRVGKMKVGGERRGVGGGAEREKEREIERESKGYICDIIPKKVIENERERCFWKGLSVALSLARVLSCAHCCARCLSRAAHA